MIAKVTKVAKGKTGKPILGVMGFLGRGNAGDEAIFQCIYEAFREEFDIVVSVDEHGAREGWWDWYPYTEIERIHQGDIHYFQKTIAGLLVGGGGLGLGFGGSQVIVARGAGTPTALAGTDHTTSYKSDNVTDQKIITHNSLRAAASRDFLRMFDYVAFRSKASVSCTMRDGVQVNYGADWALNLATDISPDIKNEPRRALVTFREYPHGTFNADYYRQEASILFNGLRMQGFFPVLLPFAPEDERFANDLGLNLLAPSEIHWWNARRIQQLIASSGLLVSIGRLHPMIFAASVGTPTVQIAPPLQPRINPARFGKIMIMTDEFSVPYMTSVDEALSESCIGGAIDMERMNAAVSEARERLRLMIADLRQLFST